MKLGMFKVDSPNDVTPELKNKGIGVADIISIETVVVAFGSPYNEIFIRVWYRYGGRQGRK